MSSNKKILKVALLATFVIIPVIFIVSLIRAKWVHKKLDYYSQEYTGPSKEKANHTVGNIVLYDQYGHKVSMGQFDSCIVVANIFFASCPEVCPKMNDQVELLAREYKRLPNVRFLTISIDPENDSVLVLRKYAARFHANDYHWQFCTGRKSEIYDWVINDLLLATEQRGQDFIHDDKLVIIDRQKNVRAILPSGGETERQKWEAYKRVRDDIENLMYEYREEDLDK